MSLPHDDKLMTRQEAAAYIGSTYATLATWDCIKRYNLRPIRISRGMVRYRKSHLDDFIRSKALSPE